MTKRICNISLHFCLHKEITSKWLFYEIKFDAIVCIAGIVLNVQNPFINCILYILLKEIHCNKINGSYEWFALVSFACATCYVLYTTLSGKREFNRKEE